MGLVGDAERHATSALYAVQLSCLMVGPSLAPVGRIVVYASAGAYSGVSSVRKGNVFFMIGDLITI
jgi:hypothetical protein